MDVAGHAEVKAEVLKTIWTSAGNLRRTCYDDPAKVRTDLYLLSRGTDLTVPNNRNIGSPLPVAARLEITKRRLVRSTFCRSGELERPSAALPGHCG